MTQRATYDLARGHLLHRLPSVSLAFPEGTITPMALLYCPPVVCLSACASAHPSLVAKQSTPLCLSNQEPQTKPCALCIFVCVCVEMLVSLSYICLISCVSGKK